MPRAFLAISLPLAVRGTFESCRDAFVARDPAWRDEKWVAPENLHVTLRFLGTIADPACEVVTDRVRIALATVEPYRLRLDCAHAIPRPRSASILWIGPGSGAEETADVAARVAGAVSFLDFAPDGRAFKTHVTLCRARRPRRVQTDAIDEVDRILHCADERSVTMSVREVTLFASTLTPRGPVYEELANIPFGG
jgi:2'-5' RNA ligase